MAAARGVKDLLGYIPFRIAAGLFALLPESWMRWLGERGGELAAKRGEGRKLLLRSHMARALGPDATEAEIEAAVVGMYRSYGRYWAETFWFRPRKSARILAAVERENFGPVFASIEAKRPRIYMLPHIGNWEVAGLVADEIGSPVTAVAEHLPNEKITNWFIDVRNKFGIDIILTSDPRRTRKLVAVLKDGGAVALVADRDVTGRGVPVEFLGERTSMPVGAIALAEMTGADLIPVGAYFRKGRGHHIKIFEPIELADLPTKEERIEDGLERFAKTLEDVIRYAPDQWHLFQPNWPSDAQYSSNGEAE